MTEVGPRLSVLSTPPARLCAFDSFFRAHRRLRPLGCARPHHRDGGAGRPADITGILPGQREQLDLLVDDLAAGGDHDGCSVHVAGATAPEPDGGAWVPEYRLVPLAGVMVDGNDLDPT